MFLQVIILLAGFFVFSGEDYRLVCGGAVTVLRKSWEFLIDHWINHCIMGTSMPGAVSITAIKNKNAGITIENVVGSNILDIFIILGITAVITNGVIQNPRFFTKFRL